MRSFLERPPGAEEHEQALQAAAVHTLATRDQRVNDVLFNIGYYNDIAKAEKKPLSRVVERDVKAPAATELPILHAAMAKKGIFPKNTFGQEASPLVVIKGDKTAETLVSAYETEKMYNSMFGGIEQRKLEAASTQDSVPTPSAANPSLRTPLKDREQKALFSFGIEDVYADVITTDRRTIEELVFENEDSDLVKMYLRKELSDIKTTTLTISESDNKMTQIALATRWSEEYAENEVRMDAVSRWRNQVAIAARNAFRDLGLRKIATDGTPKTKSLTGGKTRGNLMRMGFELGEAYPTNILVMDITTLVGWMAPTATNNIVQTIVGQDMPLNLLTEPAPNTDLGITSDNVFLTASADKILNYVRDMTLNLYVKSDTFNMRVFFDSNNLSYRGIITYDFCLVFVDRNGRIVWTIS